jgi:hypothetical protein
MSGEDWGRMEDGDEDAKCQVGSRKESQRKKERKKAILV